MAAKGNVPAKSGGAKGAAGVAAALIAYVAANPRILQMTIDFLTDPRLADRIKRWLKMIHLPKLPPRRPRPLRPALTPREELTAVLDAADQSIGELAQESAAELPIDTWRRTAHSLRLALPTLEMGPAKERRRRAKDLEKRAAKLVAEIYEAAVRLAEKESE